LEAKVDQRIEVKHRVVEAKRNKRIKVEIKTNKILKNSKDKYF